MKILFSFVEKCAAKVGREWAEMRFWHFARRGADGVGWENRPIRYETRKIIAKIFGGYSGMRYLCSIRQ